MSLALVLALAGPARAVIIASGDGHGNTTPPADDFGFANVGDAGQSAVYIGNGWVLTANHVRLGPVTLRGVRYPAVPGSRRRLKNGDAPLPPDLAVFRLQDPVPHLPALPIRATSPKIGDLVILMGNGLDRGDPLQVEGHRGWAWGPIENLRWGTNRVDELEVPVKVGRGDDTIAFSTSFSGTGQTEHEAQVAVGDSGGGAFIKNGGTWELAGLLFAASTFDEQPASTSIYGNATYAADLSVYRDQILALTSVPGCRDGLDGDGDGLVDHPLDPDCSGPDDPDEHSACDELARPGDANGDGVASGADYEIWAHHYAATGVSPAQGDFDCVGDVDGDDFRVWRASYKPARATAATASRCGGGFAITFVVPLLVSLWEPRQPRRFGQLRRFRRSLFKLQA